MIRCFTTAIVHRKAVYMANNCNTIFLRGEVLWSTQLNLSSLIQIRNVARLWPKPESRVCPAEWTVTTIIQYFLIGEQMLHSCVSDPEWTIILIEEFWKKVTTNMIHFGFFVQQINIYFFWSLHIVAVWLIGKFILLNRVRVQIDNIPRHAC